MRYLSKLAPGDKVFVQARRHALDIHNHFLDGTIHPVSIEVGGNGSSYFMECKNPSHGNRTHLDIAQQVNVSWEEAPFSLKGLDLNRYTVTVANYASHDEATITFQVLAVEKVIADNFMDVVDAHYMESGYLLITNPVTKERLYWDRLTNEPLPNKKGKDILVIQKQEVTAPPPAPSPNIVLPKKASRFEDDDEEFEVGTKEATLWFDGACKFNPGPAACAFVIKDKNNKILMEHNFSIGRATTNVAEWRGVLAGLRHAVTMDIDRLTIKGDSQLVINQLKLGPKTRDDSTIHIYNEALELLCHFRAVTLVHVSREENTYVDTLANRAF